MGRASRRRAEHRAQSAAPKTDPVLRPLTHADIAEVIPLLH
ncbi:hypothetical protein [Streptomyces sp. V4I2]|nr:hypothetical protein [Streptomyces sp. V4I2]MDQ1052047.1 hypothetical protein [Streptomyces sp. V4I2]